MVLGGAGNDTIKLERGADKFTVDGGAGADSISIETGIDTFMAKGEPATTPLGLLRVPLVSSMLWVP